MKQTIAGQDNENSFGKISAVILVLLFVTINFFKSKTDIVSPKSSAQGHLAQIKRPNSRNEVEHTRNIEKLKYAYTGNWEKNKIEESKPEQFTFTPPENTRTLVVPKVEKTSKKKTKKKVAAKKIKKDFKFSQKRSRFHMRNENDSNFNNYGNSNASYYTTNQQQQRTPSDEEKEKKLSPQEWLDLIVKENSIDELISNYNEGKMGQGLFYAIVESLITSNQESTKKLGFQALERTPSSMSLAKFAQHIKDEMSAPMKAFAQDTLSVYKKPSQLRVLNAVLNNKNNDVKIIAANIIKEIAASIVQAQASSGENVVYSEAQLKLYTVMLTQSLNVINAALENGIEGTVLASFNSARTILVQFLS